MANPTISVGQIRALENKTDSQLLEDLGYVLFEKDVGGTLPRPPKGTELVTRAKAWLAEQNEVIVALVCEDVSLRALVESTPTEREKIIIFVSNVLGAHFTGIPIATLAEILFRGGMSRYCALRWSTLAREAR